MASDPKILSPWDQSLDEALSCAYAPLAFDYACGRLKTPGEERVLVTIRGGTIMNMILLIIVILLIFGGLPQVSGGLHGAGYYPSGVGLVLVLLIVLFR